MRKIILLSAMLGMSTQGFSGWFPIPDPVDSAMKLKEIYLLVKQLESLKEHGEKFTKQIGGLANVKDSIEKKINESKKLMSGDYKFAAKYFIPGLDRWDKQFASWDKLVKKIKPKISSVNSNKKMKSTAQDNMAGVSDAAMASDSVATQTYNDVDNEISVLEKLKNDMSSADNQKSITELNTRISIQSAIIQAKNNRISAVQAKMETAKAAQQMKDAKWVDSALDWK